MFNNEPNINYKGLYLLFHLITSGIDGLRVTSLTRNPEAKPTQTCQPLPRAVLTCFVILDYLCDKPRSWHPPPKNNRLKGITDKGWQV